MIVTISIEEIEKEIKDATKGSRFGATDFHKGRLAVLESLLYGKLNPKQALKVKHRGENLGKKVGIC